MEAQLESETRGFWQLWIFKIMLSLFLGSLILCHLPRNAFILLRPDSFATSSTMIHTIHLLAIVAVIAAVSSPTAYAYSLFSKTTNNDPIESLVSSSSSLDRIGLLVFI